MNEAMDNDKWTLKLPRKHHFEAKVTFIYHNGIIEELRSLLNEQQMGLFNQSCLRHFIHLPKLQNCGALVHSLLLREVVNANFVDESMRFLVGGQILEFSRRDFALILGLPMDRCVFLGDVVPNENWLKTKYFDGMAKINLPAMMSAIQNCLDDEDKVKLACVCLLEYFLLGKDKISSAVDDRHLDLVDDLEEFNKYPWGREIHERTFKYLRKAVALRSFKKQEKKVKRSKKSSEKTREKLEKYTLLGFPYILQVWAYEVIRQVGVNFAVRTEVAEGPRILHWRCEKWPTYKQLNDLVFELKQVDVTPISPSRWELTQLSILKVDDDDMDLDSEDYESEQADADEFENCEDDNDGDADTLGQQDMETDISDGKNLLSHKYVEIATLREAYQQLQTKHEQLQATLEQQPSTHDHHQLILLPVELTSTNRASHSQHKVVHKLPDTIRPQSTAEKSPSLHSLKHNTAIVLSSDDEDMTSPDENLQVVLKRQRKASEASTQVGLGSTNGIVGDDFSRIGAINNGDPIQTVDRTDTFVDHGNQVDNVSGPWFEELKGESEFQRTGGREGLMNIGNFPVQEKFAALYRQIWERHGHLATRNAIKTSTCILVVAVSELLESITEMATAKPAEVDSSLLDKWEGKIKDAEELKFNVSWLRKLFDEVRKTLDAAYSLRNSQETREKALKSALQRQIVVRARQDSLKVELQETEQELGQVTLEVLQHEQAVSDDLAAWNKYTPFFEKPILQNAI